ncbi:MAG: DUF3419 family protein [Pseudomonadota bacterium]
MTQAVGIRQQLGAAVHQSDALSKTGVLERMFSSLFKGMVYPQIWEDPVADMNALRIQSGDNLVCIASGGCNVMSYLTAGPASVTAVDLSPAHVALNRLKAAAAIHLPDHASFYALFGQADRRVNLEIYRTLSPHLDPQTRAYWEGRGPFRRRYTQLSRGFYRFGALGRFIGAAHLVARIGRVDFRPFLASRSLDEQKAFFEAQIAPLFDRRLVGVLARRRASLFGLGIPPAQYDKLAADGGGDIIPVLRERTRKLMCDFPLAENYFAWQAFARRYGPEHAPATPPYLEPGQFEALRAAAPRFQIHNRSLTDVLASMASASKQCYVLLDAQDWMTDAQLNALWSQITRTASPGARVIFRTGGAASVLTGRLDPALLDQWSYDAEASSAGFEADRSAIYGGFHLYVKQV